MSITLELKVVLIFVFYYSFALFVSYLILAVAVDQASGQSYKLFTLAICESIVVIWGIVKSGTNQES